MMAEAKYAAEVELDELQQWFENHPKLPKRIERVFLRRFYGCMHNNVEATKGLILKNYELRNKNKKIFIQRDPRDEDTRSTFAYSDIIYLPGLTPDRYRIVLNRLTDFDANCVHFDGDTKTFLMVADCVFSLPDEPQEDAIGDGLIQIFDLQGFAMRHVYRVSISTFRVYMAYLQTALPANLRAVYLINCPPFLDRIMKFVKRFISDEVFALLHFYAGGIESIYEFIPREMLPEEYGGEAGKMEQLKADSLKLLEARREYLMDPRYWKTD